MLWFRLYSEFATDPKVQMMPEDLQRRLIMLMCLRSNAVTETFHDDEIMFALRIDETQMKRTRNEFMQRGFVTKDWKIINWNKRQYQSDSSTSRVRKCRDKKKLKQVGNVSATPPDTERQKERENQSSVAIQEPRAETAAFRKVYDAGSDLFPALATRNTASITKWIAAGADPLLDILPTLKASAGREIKSWSYFDGAVMDALAHRLKPLPEGKTHETNLRCPAVRAGKSAQGAAAILRGLGLDAEG